MSKTRDVIVKQSKIHGAGVFVARDFKKGEVVLRWHPKVLTKQEAEKLSESEKGYTYKIQNDRYYLMQEPEKFVNHSCENNTHVVDGCDIALRDIRKGEEITANYNNDGLVSFQCRCGASHCRGFVR